MGTRRAERAGSGATGWLYRLNFFAETDLRDIRRTPSFQYACDLAGLYQNEENFLSCDPAFPCESKIAKDSAKLRAASRPNPIGIGCDTDETSASLRTFVSERL